MKTVIYNINRIGFCILRGPDPFVTLNRTVPSMHGIPFAPIQRVSTRRTIGANTQHMSLMYTAYLTISIFRFDFVHNRTEIIRFAPIPIHIGLSETKKPETANHLRLKCLNWQMAESPITVNLLLHDACTVPCNFVRLPPHTLWTRSASL